MALAQRLEIADHEARLAAGNFTDGPYGSLLGSRMGKPKKKPVLVLDADELAEARVAMAMGGAQIMEEADDPLAAERRPMPSMLLGLAPIDADDEWEPEIAPAAFADKPVAPAEAFEPFVSDAGEFDPEEGLYEWAEDAAPPPATAIPAFDLPLPEEEAEEDEDSLPSIEEQLARMRCATAAPVAQPCATQQPTAIERLGDIWPPFAPPADAAAPLPDPHIAGDEAEAPEPPQIEPVFAAPLSEPEADESAEDEAVFDLPADAMVPQDDWAQTEEPEPDGPDLAWMMPPEPRQLHIEEGAHNSLRARLLREEAEAAEEAALSLWDRLREWVAGLFSRR